MSNIAGEGASEDASPKIKYSEPQPISWAQNIWSSNPMTPEQRDRAEAERRRFADDQFVQQLEDRYRALTDGPTAQALPPSPVSPAPPASPAIPGAWTQTFPTLAVRPYTKPEHRHSLPQYMLEVPEKPKWGKKPRKEAPIAQWAWNTRSRPHYEDEAEGQSSHPNDYEKPWPKFTPNNRSDDPASEVSVLDPGLKGAGVSSAQDDLYADIDQALYARFGCHAKKTRRNSAPRVEYIENPEPLFDPIEDKSVTPLANAWRFIRTCMRLEDYRVESVFDFLFSKKNGQYFEGVLSVSAFQRFLNYLMYTLEDACFRHLRRESLPWISTLRCRRAEDLQLSSWVLVIQQYFNSIRGAHSHSEIPDHLYRKVTQQRHNAVHGKEVEGSTVQGAFDLLQLLEPGDETRRKAITAVVKMLFEDHPPENLVSKVSFSAKEADPAEMALTPLHRGKRSIKATAELIFHDHGSIRAAVDEEFQRPGREIRAAVTEWPVYRSHSDALLILRTCSKEDYEHLCSGGTVIRKASFVTAEERAIGTAALEEIETRQTVYHIHARAQKTLEGCLAAFHDRFDITPPPLEHTKAGPELQIVARALRMHFEFTPANVGDSEKRAKWRALLFEAHEMRNAVAHRSKKINQPTIDFMDVAVELIKMCRTPPIQPETDQKLEEIEVHMLADRELVQNLRATRVAEAEAENEKLTQRDWQERWHVSCQMKSRLNPDGFGYEDAQRNVYTRLQETAKLCMVKGGYDSKKKRWPGGPELEDWETTWMFHAEDAEMPE